MKHPKWLDNPNKSGEKVLVCRGFWGWLFRSGRYATKEEVICFRAWQLGNKNVKH